MDLGQNRREFTRVRVNMFTKLVSGEIVEIVGKMSNVSLNGIFLECDASLPIGTACEVSLILEGGADKIDICAAGIVRRIEPSGMAVQFIKLFGSESLTHLQNLVLYNSGDQVAQVEKDFLEHTGLKISG